MFVRVMALVVVVTAMVGCAVPTRTATSPQGQVVNMCDYGGNFLQEAYARGKSEKNRHLVDTYFTWSDWYYGNACEGGPGERLAVNDGSRAEWKQHADSVCTGMKGMLIAFKPYGLDHYGQLESAYDNNCTTRL